MEQGLEGGQRCLRSLFVPLLAINAVLPPAETTRVGPVTRPRSFFGELFQRC